VNGKIQLSTNEPLINKTWIFNDKHYVLSGVVSNLRYYNHTSGSIDTDDFTGRVHGSVNTTHWITFRVNNRTVMCKYLPEIGNGDIVTVLAHSEPTQFVVEGLRNDTTGVWYSCPISSKNSAYKLGIKFILIGIVFSLIGLTLGFLFAVILCVIPSLLIILLGLYYINSATFWDMYNDILYNRNAYEIRDT